MPLSLRSIWAQNIIRRHKTLKLTSAGSVTDNKWVWLEFLGIIDNDVVPAPSFDQIVLQRLL